LSDWPIMDNENVLFQATSHKRQSWITDHATHVTCKCTNESLEEALDVMEKRGNFNKEDPTIMKYIFFKFLNFQPYKWQNQNLETKI